MTFDVRSNSPFVSQSNACAWKENLPIYQKSLRAFFQAPLQFVWLYTCRKKKTSKSIKQQHILINPGLTINLRLLKNVFKSLIVARSSKINESRI